MSFDLFKLTKGAIFIVSIQNEDFKYLTCLPYCKEDSESSTFKLKNGKILRFIEEIYMGTQLFYQFEILDNGDKCILHSDLIKYIEHINTR